MDLTSKLSLRFFVFLLTAFLSFSFDAKSQMTSAKNTALLNGLWFNGSGFEAKTLYSVNGFFTAKKPSHIDTTIDLENLYIIPPFAEAHNHNLNGGNPRNKKAIEKYLDDGVFYVKEPSNFFLGEEEQAALGMNRPTGIDVSLAQGASLTATWGHPYQLAEDVWFKFGYAKGPVDSLNGRRFFTIDSEEDLEKKWNDVLKQKPAFIKTTLWASDEFVQRNHNKAFYGMAGLNPALLPKIVAKAHAAGLRVTTHTTTAADFHNAVAAGVDEAAHLPFIGLTPITEEDAKLAAKRNIMVITTCALAQGGRPPSWPKEELPDIQRVQKADLKRLHDNGVVLAVGSDAPNDSSVGEAEYLQKLGVFDNATLLKMWTKNSAKTIFPKRKIGELKEGYEASFLALDGNPLDDFSNVRKINLRLKQGYLLTVGQ